MLFSCSFSRFAICEYSLVLWIHVGLVNWVWEMVGRLVVFLIIDSVEFTSSLWFQRLFLTGTG